MHYLESDIIWTAPTITGDVEAISNIPWTAILLGAVLLPVEMLTGIV